MVQSTVLFWIEMGYHGYGMHACSIPLFQDHMTMTEPELCEFIILFKYLLLIGF